MEKSNSRRTRTPALLLLLALGGVLPLLAEQQSAPPAPAQKPADKDGVAVKIRVQLVTDFETGTLVSEREEFQPVVTTVFTDQGSDERLLGEKCTLWVRNAHVDGRFFFERFYQGKYIGRRSEVEIDLAALGAGEHVIQPGNHRFTVGEDGRLTSDDPDIRIVESRVMLRMHRVEVFGVEGGRNEPAEFRKVPAELGMFYVAADDFSLDAGNLPDPSRLLDPQNPPAEGQDRPALVNALSHQRPFYPLTVWLPSNRQGPGYVLYPSWQAFHVTTEGRVELAAGDAPRVPGIELEDNAILIPHRTFTGKVNSHSGLQGGVGAAALAGEMVLGATLQPLRFRAGIGEPPEEFYLEVDNDFTRLPNKFFLADNLTAQRDAVRLMALEWNDPLFVRGSEATVALRLLQSPEHTSLAQPVVRMDWSPYTPSQPLARDWRTVEVLRWNNDPRHGELAFRVPDAAFGFVALRVQIFASDDPRSTSSLAGEMVGCILEPDQTGTASFVTNKGRNAFVCGEDVHLHLVFRSRENRPPGTRTVVLTHPDGHRETLAVEDDGAPWRAVPLRLPPERTARLEPGTYRLTVDDPPPGITAVPLSFELAGRDKPSLFHIVKPSKYTGPMNQLEVSHLQGKPVDLDRAMATLADLGYTRVDLMTYVTNHHLRAYTWREQLAALDSRLPPPEAVYTPTPRDQMLNACVRNGLQYSDVWLSYGDFHLPRQIEPYIRASERWFAREMQAMRHSPALDGMMLYDEMYQMAVTGIVESHQKYFAAVRAELASKELGQTPAQIEQAFNRYLQRPASQRDPEALEAFIRYKDWQQRSWQDYVRRVVAVGKHLLSTARFGTYHRTWMLPGANDDLYHGYPPDLFQPLDIISHVHYADNATCWVNIAMMAQILRTGADKTLYVNLPLLHEVRTHSDGQYQRQMAFALLSQGANGISHWGLQHTFGDGPNPGTAQGRETTGPLNHHILRPFGELIDRTRPGYRRVGIVSTMRQHALAEFKFIAPANQTEGLWVACWRLGYPATFIREEHCRQPLDGYSVIFVPGVRFEGELDEMVIRRLREAIAAGVRVVVERDSVLDLPGITRLQDFPLQDYFVGNYFATWHDDELNKVYEKSQPIVDYLRPKLLEWEVEPAARGPFTVGPNWRDGGDAQYLVMANFEDPPYRHTVRQQMARPVVMPLDIPAHRGAVAYDLLAQRELPLAETAGSDGGLRRLDLDMTRVQGGLVALLPRRIGGLKIHHAVAEDRSRLRLTGELLDEAAEPLRAVFPVRIVVYGGNQPRTYFRVLGEGQAVELDLPHARAPREYRVEIREALSGRTCTLKVAGGLLAEPNLEALDPLSVRVPYPAEVSKFLREARSLVVVPAPRLPAATEAAKRLVARLAARKVKARLADEATVYHLPTGDPDSEDPLGDGFHSWRKGQEVIAPATVVDEDVILVGGRGSSFLLEMLAQHGYLTDLPLGGPGLAVQPSLQVAHKGLHFAHDTLCVIGNDASSLQAAIEQLLGDLPPARSPATPALGAPAAATGNQATPLASAVGFMGTNDTVLDVRFDPHGNLYAITWGHGKNLYSLAPDGEARFSRHLPEMGTNRLEVFDGGLFAYTAAGARLYRLDLEGVPRWQARLNMDPGSTHMEDNYHLSHVDFTYLPQRRLLLHNHGDFLRVLDDDLNMVAQWSGEAYEDKDVSDETLHRTLGAYAVSPDGTRIAQLENSLYHTKSGYLDLEVYDSHVVLRQLDGKLLAEHKDVDNFTQVDKNSAQRARIDWPADAPGPRVYVKGVRLSFDAELQLAETTPYAPGEYLLGGERRLVRDGQALIYYDSLLHQQCRVGPLAVMPTYVRLSPDGQHLALLDEYGRLSLWQTTDGSRRAEWQVPQLGEALRFTPDSQRLVLGTFRGEVLVYNLDGTLVWQRRLGKWNDVLGQELPLYDPTIPDYTEKLWPVSRDRPEELDELVRMDVDRLVNGDAEGEGGWHGAVQYHAEGHQSPRSLRVGPEMVTQEVSQFLGEHVTWVAEFFYRSAPPGEAAELLAGVLIEGTETESIARRFQADGGWRYGRVAIKNGAQCRKMTLGFASHDGEVLVDSVRFRRIRFPSINHMLYEPLHSVQPILLDNPLYADKYNPCGPLREQAPNRILVQSLKTGPLNLVESAFLQNGRLNDVSSQWYIQPHDEDPTISCGLAEPRWISMVALYFNVFDEAHITPHFDIYASDMETGKDRLVASIRHNGQVFRLVKFSPVKTPLVKIKLVNSIARLRTVTEIELYGPLSGREGVPGFVDADGQNTYMGDFSRVDRRKKSLADAYLPPSSRIGGHDDEINWFAPLAQPLVSEDVLYLGRTLGKNSAHPITDPATNHYLTRANGLGFTPYGTLYGGLIVRAGNDGRLYCLSSESGAVLWSTELGRRLFGCPVILGEDIYVASDRRKLYQVDLASGSIFKEADMPGTVFGALATDGTRLYFIADTGHLHAWRAADLQPLWQFPIAADTDSTPAVDDGVVYLADQQGTAFAVRAEDGSLVWQAPLGDEFVTCPVVTPEAVFYGCRGGTLAALNRSDGALLWSRQVKSRFYYEPLVLEQGVLYFDDQQAMLADPHTGRAQPLELPGAAMPNQPPPPPHRFPPGDPIAPLAYYRGHLFVLPRTDHDQYHVVYPWHPTGGVLATARPAPPPPEPKEAGQ